MRSWGEIEHGNNQDIGGASGDDAKRHQEKIVKYAVEASQK
jgi:hypothetical protein